MLKTATAIIRASDQVTHAFVGNLLFYFVLNKLERYAPLVKLFSKQRFNLYFLVKI